MRIDNINSIHRTIKSANRFSTSLIKEDYTSDQQQQQLTSSTKNSNQIFYKEQSINNLINLIFKL